MNLLQLPFPVQVGLDIATSIMILVTCIVYVRTSKKERNQRYEEFRVKELQRALSTLIVFIQKAQSYKEKVVTAEVYANVDRQEIDQKALSVAELLELRRPNHLRGGLDYLFWAKHELFFLKKTALEVLKKETENKAIQNLTEELETVIKTSHKEQDITPLVVTIAKCYENPDIQNKAFCLGEIKGKRYPNSRQEGLDFLLWVKHELRILTVTALEVHGTNPEKQAVKNLTQELQEIINNFHKTDDVATPLIESVFKCYENLAISMNDSLKR